MAGRNEYKVEWSRQDKLKNPEKYRLRYEQNKEKSSAKHKEVYQLNKEKIKARVLAYYHKNKETLKPKRREQGRKYRDENKEKWQEKNKKWWAANPEKRIAYVAKRRAKHRMPKWVDKEEKFLINEAYSLAKLRAKMTGIKWHVDHIIPLLADKASGLHTIYNLQVIPAKLNYLKNNKYEV